MSKPEIPKGQLTPYQRWELDSFDERREIKETSIAYPTASEIEQIHQDAHQEGYAAGQREGYDAGKKQGYEEGYRDGMMQAKEKVDSMHLALTGLNQELQRLDEEISQEILSLSLAIARQVIRKSLDWKPEILLEVVREAVGKIPPFSQQAHLRLNPEDAALVRQEMGDELEHTNWKIIEDSRIERGGCKIETSSSEIDATLANRWSRVVSSMARNDEWIAK
ncbi:MAG: flagellar assembly protein FliH [Burkholderiales bacterium]|nr:flagellar assembly protein FliH [Burkholderiales bacterium]